MGKEQLKQCETFNKGLCLGCTGLGELDWIGATECEIYKKLQSFNGLELCKKILKGDQQKL